MFIGQPLSDFLHDAIWVLVKIIFMVILGRASPKGSIFFICSKENNSSLCSSFFGWPRGGKKSVTMKGVGKLVLVLVAAFALLQALLFLMLPRTRDFVVRPLSRPVVEYLDKYSSEGLLEVVLTKHFWESMVSYWKGQKPPRRPFKPTWQPPSAEAFEQARKQRELEEAERVKREIVPKQAHPDDLRVLQHLVSLGWFESVPACAKQPPVVCDFEGHVIELTLKGRPLGGSIPAELAGLRQLERLNLAGTGLQGTIPQALGSLKRLSKLVLAEDGPSGS